MKDKTVSVLGLGYIGLPIAELFASQFFILIPSLILSIFIARSLGDVIFGKFYFALAFMGIFGVFSDLGLSTLTVREVAWVKPSASKFFKLF